MVGLGKICFDKQFWFSATKLILFLETYSWITVYPIHPITLQKFREAFVTSRAKDDGKDAEYLAELLLTHQEKLKPWLPDDSQTQRIIWKCWQAHTIYKEQIYKAALAQRGSPIISLLDQIELGKSPVKTTRKNL